MQNAREQKRPPTLCVLAPKRFHFCCSHSAHGGGALRTSSLSLLHAT